MLDKKPLRGVYRAKRAGVLKNFLQLHDISTSLLSLISGISGVKVLGGYYPTKDELDIRPILNSLKNDYVISLPKMITSREMRFTRWEGDIILNKDYQFYETDSSHFVIPQIAIIPLICCDRFGNRVGYGKGHYDRYLADNPSIIKISLMPHELLIDKRIRNERHDIKLDYIITEKKIIILRN